MYTANDLTKALKNANVNSLVDLKQVADRFEANAKKIRDVGSAVSTEIMVFKMFLDGLGFVQPGIMYKNDLKIIKLYESLAQMIEKRAAWYKKFVKKMKKVK